jgi:hypothetical protein
MVLIDNAFYGIQNRKQNRIAEYRICKKQDWPSTESVFAGHSAIQNQ